MSLPPSIRAALGALSERLTTKFGVRLSDVRLFGSYARGDAREDSDVDVLVVVDDLTFAEHRTILDLAGDLFYETGHLISPTSFETAAWRLHVSQQRPLAAAIEREGVRP